MTNSISTSSRKLWQGAALLLLLAGSAVASTVQQDWDAHKHGNVDATRRIAYRYYKGNGLKASLPAAVKWFRQAADKGDVQSMVMMGDFYSKGEGVKKDIATAKSFYEKAAAKGSEKAEKRLAAMREYRTDSEVKGNNYTSGKLVGVVVKDLVARAKKSGVKSISMVEFRCNGKKTTPMSTYVRDKLLEKITDDGNLDVYDRLDSKLVAQEQSLSFDGAPLDPATAVLMGEIFCKPGDSYGYFAYRVFKAQDTRVIATGCERVKWSDSEMEMLAELGNSKGESLPFIPDSSLSELTSKLKQKVNSGIAMVQDRSKMSDNVVHSRLAYAQIVQAIFDSGNIMFEREYILQAAEESMLADKDIDPSRGVSALGYVQYIGSSKSENNLKVQVTACPGGKLLSTINLKQNKGFDL